MSDDRNGLGGVYRFFNSQRPIRFWCNVRLHCHSPEDASISVRNLFDVEDYGPAEDCVGETRRSYDTVNIARSILMVIDMKQMKQVTTRQLAAYVAIVGLADIRLNARDGTVRIILRLCHHPKRLPQGLSVWDQALLYPLYDTRQASKLQLQDMESIMMSRITRHGIPGRSSSRSSSSAPPRWANEVLPRCDSPAIYRYQIDAE